MSIRYRLVRMFFLRLYHFGPHYENLSVAAAAASSKSISFFNRIRLFYAIAVSFLCRIVLALVSASHEHRRNTSPRKQHITPHRMTNAVVNFVITLKNFMRIKN